MQNASKINKDISLQGVTSFQQTSIAPFLIQCLTKCGFTRPTPIQYHSITSFTQHPTHSMIAQSKSGTGKTLAFLIPIINTLCTTPTFSSTLTHTIILLPTRQLSIQVHQYLKQLINSSQQIKAHPLQKQFKANLRNLSSLLTIGGIPIEDDKKTLLTSGANFVIGTVGRIFQLMESGCLKVEGLMFAVLDEGDKLFATKDEKLEKILKRVRNCLVGRQSKPQQKKQQQEETQKFRFMVYSATYDEKSIKKITQALSKVLSTHPSNQPNFTYIQTLTNSITNEFIQKVTQNWRQLNFVTFANSINQRSHNDSENQPQQNKPNQQKEMNKNSELINLENIKKFWIPLDLDKDKNPVKGGGSIIVRKCHTLKLLLSQLSYKKCLIFVQKKALLQQITDQIKEFQPLLIHGSLSQASRIKAMNQANRSKIIISSDLLARGIDLVLDLVILFDAHINETFWHRIGRTGRFGRVGVVVSLDRIEGWEEYEEGHVNGVLKGSCVEEEGGLRKNQWYGTYMTEYGRWEEVDLGKEQVINKGYKFYMGENVSNPNNIEREEIERGNKKAKKELKQQSKELQQKQIKQKIPEVIEQKFKLHTLGTQNKPKLQLKRSFISQQQFRTYYKAIFSCESCKNLMKSTTKVTGYQFEIEKYFSNKQDDQTSING